jgi:hypothetical protein
MRLNGPGGRRFRNQGDCIQLVNTGKWSQARLAERQPEERQTYPRDLIQRLVAAQPTLRDQIAIQLLGRLALRKNELRILRLREIVDVPPHAPYAPYAYYLGELHP